MSYPQSYGNYVKDVIELLINMEKDDLIILNYNPLFPLILIAPPTPYPLIAHLYPHIASIPPLGIGYLSSFIKHKGGYDSIIFNLYLEIIRDVNPSIIGFSTMTETFKNGVRLAKIIKETFQNVKIVFGGPHVTFLDFETLKKYPFIDIVVRGEGEITFLEIVSKILDGDKDLSQIKGITYREGEEIIRNKSREFIKNLDEIPFPNREVRDIDGFFDLVPVQQMVISSRGCPGACKFCAATAMSGGKIRYRSIPNVIEEILLITYNKKDDKSIFFGDDTLTADVKRFSELKELCIEMKESGCYGIQFGVESGS